jgi:predicted DsbA family dithiol-disulfide isomerase
MRIDVVSDTVCPWCFVGKRRLERAIALRPELAFEVHWHPFQLNPDVPSEGVDRKTYYAEKFGSGGRIEAMVEQLKTIGTELEINFDFEAIQTQPNTRLSHSLISAFEGPSQNAVKEGVLTAFFEQGRDIGSRDVLLDVAAELALDADLARAALDDPALQAAVAERSEQARANGINGVPTFIFDQLTGFSGAQEETSFLQMFDQDHGST